MSFSRVLFLSSSLLASATVQGNEEQIERIVTTAYRDAAAISDIPMSVSQLDQDILDLFSPIHIEEVMKTVAGANFHRANGQEYLPALRSQVFSGAGACGGILMMENSIPLRAPGFCNINELFEAHTEIASQIDVIKGPGSAHYGSNAVHGMINIITPAANSPSSFMLDMGSFGYTRARARHSENTEYGDISLGVSLTRDTGYRDDESVDMQKVTLKHQGQVGDWQVETGLSHMRLDQETASFVVGEKAFEDRQLSQANDDPEAFREARATRLYSRWRKTLGEDASITLTPYLRDQAMRFRMHFLPGTPFETNSQTGMGLLTQYKQDLNEQWTIRAGFDSDFTRGKLSQEQFEPTQGSNFLQATIPVGRHYDYVVDAMQLAPYVQLEWQSDSTRVQLGLRSEYTEYDYDNLMLSGRTDENGVECGFGGCRYSRPESRTDDFLATSPKLGILYDIDANFQLFTNLSSGFRAPQATELYRLQREQVVADLDNEEVVSAELGVRYGAQDINWTLAAYHMRKDNVIFRDSDFFNISGGKTQHQGVELEGSWMVSPSVQFVIASTYAVHQYKDRRLLGELSIFNNDIDSAPRHVGNAQLNWQMNPSLSSHIELHWVGPYYMDAENRNRYEGHELVNYRAMWRYSDSLNFTARVLNLLDERYAERADFTGFSGERYFPGEPRSFWITAQWNY